MQMMYCKNCDDYTIHVEDKCEECHKREFATLTIVACYVAISFILFLIALL